MATLIPLRYHFVLGTSVASRSELHVRTQCTDLHELITLFRPLFRDQVLFIPMESPVDTPELYQIEVRLADDSTVLRGRGQTVDPFAKGISTGGYKGIAILLTQVNAAGQALMAELSSTSSGTMPFGIPQAATGKNRILCSIEITTNEEEQTTERKPSDIEEQTRERRPDEVEEQTSELDPKDLVSAELEGPTRDASGKGLLGAGKDMDFEATAVNEAQSAPPLPGVDMNAPTVADDDEAPDSEEVTSLDRPTFSPHSARAKSNVSADESAQIPATYALPLTSSKSKDEDKSKRLPLTSPPSDADLSAHMPESVKEEKSPDFATGSAPRPMSAPLPVSPADSQSFSSSSAIPAAIQPGYSQQVHQSSQYIQRAVSHTDQLDTGRRRKGALILTGAGCLVAGLTLGYLLFGGDAKTKASDEALAATKTETRTASNQAPTDVPAPVPVDDPAMDEGNEPSNAEGSDTEEPLSNTDPVPEANDAPESADPMAELAPAFVGSACQGTIRSEPPRVAVFQHGVLVGATPYDGPILCDSLDFELVLPGFKRKRLTATMDENKRVELDIAMERPKYKVVVQSVPRKAMVKMDGKFIGRAPVTLYLPAFEPTTIKVVKSGFKAQEKELNLSSPRSVVKVRLPRR